MPHCYFCYEDAGSRTHHPACVKNFFGTPEFPVLTLNDTLLQELARKTINQRIAVTGVQPKLSVTLEKAKNKDRLTIVGLWGEYILKPQQHQFPFMPENEDLTMHLAGLFKIPVCDHTLIPVSDGSVAYLARRFDRKGEKKIHVEDLCQLSGLLTENKYKSSYERAGKLVATHCDRMLDVLNYFELILFSYLTGNNDMHLKNFSVMHLADSVILSPAYDLLNVHIVNPKDREELGLMLGGKKINIRLKDFKALAVLLKINEKACDNTFKLFSSKNREVADMIDCSFLNSDMKKKYKKTWADKQRIFD